MACHYAKWCMLIWLTGDFAKLVLSTGNAIEFGARLRAINKHEASNQTTLEAKSSKTNVQNSWIHLNSSVPLYRLFNDKRSQPVQNAKNKDSKQQQNQRTNVKIMPMKPTLNLIYENSKGSTNDENNSKGNTNDENDSNGAFKKRNLIPSQNLQFKRIEPFWPFSNISSIHLSNSFKLPKEQNNGFPYENLPERFKDTTFFFSHVGPNSFEYRAQFHHSLNDFEPAKFFKPFVDEYPEFPKITFPQFPLFPETPKIFEQKPQLPEYPNSNGISFPQLEPELKRILQPTFQEPGEIVNPEKTKFLKPFIKPFDVILGGDINKYPKIFTFNEERINIEDFEKQKKMQMLMNGLKTNSLNEPENVQRNHLLILHGGIFTVKEPPLYNRKLARKRRQRFRYSNRIIK